MHAADAEEGGVTHRPRSKLIPSLSLSYISLYSLALSPRIG